VSVIAYSSDGNIELINKTAKKLFQLATIKNIKSLEPLSPELVSTLLNIRPGENKLVKLQYDDDILQLAIFASTIKVKDKLIFLVTIKDIQNVLEEQETEAWQKLIRVLTHEIMNSITPIASLSSTLDLMLKGMVGQGNGDELRIDNESVGEIQEALQTINKRSTGLLHFVILQELPGYQANFILVNEVSDRLKTNGRRNKMWFEFVVSGSEASNSPQTTID
jgi:hypothetical protein